MVAKHQSCWLHHVKSHILLLPVKHLFLMLSGWLSLSFTITFRQVPLRNGEEEPHLGGFEKHRFRLRHGNDFVKDGMWEDVGRCWKMFEDGVDGKW